LFIKKHMSNKSSLPGETKINVARRSFLKLTGLGAATLAVGSSACHVSKKTSEGRLDVGERFLSVLNYAYALEQLEGAFYEKLTSAFYSGATEMERDLLTDIRNDEIAHREWLKDVLSLKRLPKLEFDFSSINFRDRASVLNAAKMFEDTGVAAYNGAGKLLQLSPFLNHAGKIVSVEARHAATIRNLISFGSFADDTVSDSNGRDLVKTPQEVMALADKYFITKISVADLPKS
jgi:hypothetical protein